MTKRSRLRNKQPALPPPKKTDPVQDLIDIQADELLMLWRILPAALARDSVTSSIGGERHGTGGAKGSPAGLNFQVLEVASIIETGLTQLSAEATAILHELNPAHGPTHLLCDDPSCEDLRRPLRRTPSQIITSIPRWHRELAHRGQPLARYLAKDLAAWLRMAQSAIGIQSHDTRSDLTCPHHPDALTGLLEVGPQARLNPTLLAGPPGRDWIMRGGEWAWSSTTGQPAFVWQASGAIRCPRCKRTWTTVAERRALAKEATR
ncbi:hypothetical protein ACSMXN_09330 [Jatrophihabitans sp. DSM 45814]